MIPRFLVALALFAPFLRAEPIVAPAKWEKEISAIETRHPPKSDDQGGIVFIGSSSIRMWSSLAEDFPKHRVANHGFGGSQISDSIQYVDRLVTPYQPRLIVMYAGGNDINAGKNAETVAADFKTFVEKVRAKQPDVPISYISVAPNPKRWSQIETVKKANALIAEYCAKTPRLKFIDVFTHMLGPDGQPKPDIFLKDQLHMNPKGYAIWKEVVGPELGAPDA
ncbi:MAG TPA: SGNH/GDSL hydrolase family protein [Chthoniobacteraceae bacterium]|nr:SGNH/GDSL hydrolase family protein [Chthoniobacteraceae bacterium]